MPRPAEVTALFRARVAAALAPLGFSPRAQGARFVRRRGRVVEAVELSSSHRNTPDDVTCHVALIVQDPAVRARQPHWRAGGLLDALAPGDPLPQNVADPAQADALLARLLEGLALFDLAADPDRVAAEVGRRYVPGFVEPAVVVPYLSVRLGPDAARTYAASLLEHRHELWPAFASAQAGLPMSRGHARPDQGTELAEALAAHAPGPPLPAPPDTAPCGDLADANLRCFLGRQLRAWGEPEAARLLRRAPDERIREVRRAQEQRGFSVDDPGAAALAMEAATGEPSPPRREAPRPRYFQYFVLHEPFGR